MKKSKTKFIYTYPAMTLGAFILASGLNTLLVPNKISIGGVSSIATVLLYTLGIPLSVTNIAANAVLIIAGLRYLTKASLIKNLYGVLALSLFLELTKNFPTYSDDSLLACIFGGAFSGIGLGIVMRYGGSTGGSDFASLILNHLFPHIPIARLLFIIDGIIVLFSGMVFKSITVMLYSLIGLFVCARVTDTILTSGFSAKSVYIITDREKEVSDIIITQLHRGVTGIKSVGMYTGKERYMLICIVSAKQLPTLTKKVRETDKNSFIIISQAHEVFGEGFRKEIGS